VKWISEDGDGWRWRFALLPRSIRIEGGRRQWVWLEWYRVRFCGDHYEVFIPGTLS
jgi:hypothetical protein